ncbi:MAG: OmpA family protein, partial [Cyclobacteriaceae bacterium]
VYGPFLAPVLMRIFLASYRCVNDRVGGSVMYNSTRLDESWVNWSEPVTLGHAINTSSEDAYFSIDVHGNIFTARAGNVTDGGNFDLLILKPRNIKITLVGNVFNQKTQQPVVAALEVKMKDQKPVNIKSSATGKFETRIPEVPGYTITAASNGFLPFVQDYKVPAKLVRDTTLHIDIGLMPIAKQLSLAGDVVDKKTNIPVANARINIVSKSDRTIEYKLNSADGKYAQDIPGLGWYVYSVSAEGYLNATDSVQAENPDITPLVKNIFLTPIEVGITVRLKNIYFDFDKTTLKPESFVELNKVVDFLKQNPKVSIEIAGHTDSKGSDTYNENLSQGRSQSVVDYLASQGIDASRLQAHGYGESKPIDSNETEEGRANNRRVEFTVVKM